LKNNFPGYIHRYSGLFLWWWAKPRLLFIICIVTVTLQFVSLNSFAQYTKLFDFDGPPNSSSPLGSLVSDGTFLYGMTYAGGTNDVGTIFKVMPDGTGYSKLLEFNFDIESGRLPHGSLIFDGTFLYGMTRLGGTNNFGIIFKIMPDGTGYSKLLDFNGAGNGGYPEGSLISDGSFLYGMTAGGGTNSLGTIFKILPDGTGYSKLLDFDGAANGSNAPGSLIFDGTFLYGITIFGGTNDLGTIFKIFPDGTGYSKLLDFDGALNGNPTTEASLISDGAFLYGLTNRGGANDMGTIFKIMPDGTGYSKLLDFAGNTNGRYPRASPISDGVFLYGTTQNGGTNDLGTVFKIMLDGTGYSKLLDFEGAANGANATASLFLTGSFLYGMTYEGGSNNLGTVFKYLNPRDHFWIGNSGDWKDANHWSLTSGGPSSGSIPGIDDNVFFDANSFTLPGQGVSILDEGTNVGAVFKTMDWRGVTNSPTFQIRRSASAYVFNECYGSLYFSDNMILDFDGAEFYMVGNVDYEFDTRGHNMGQNGWLWFNSQAAGTGNILSDINHAWIYCAQGTVNLNGHTFLGINNGNNVEQQNYPAIWLANAAATLNISNSSVDVGTIQMATGSTLIDDNADITIRDRINGTTGQNFNHVILGSVTMVGTTANTFQTLEILPGSTVKFASSQTQTINNFTASGTRLAPIIFESSIPGVTATLQKSSGQLDLYWVRLKDIAATGGATFNAHGSWNDGNITGWNFKADSLDRIALDALYTSTNGSNWTNPSLWQSGSSDSRIVMDNGAVANGGRVTSLLLSNNNLVGDIPDEITAMDQLELLDLSNNSISSMPDLTIMPSLTTLNVSGNSLDFEDLEKNASIIEDDGIDFYEDQVPLASTPYEEIQVDLPHVLVLPEPAGGTPANNSYLWKFKPYYQCGGDTTNFSPVSNQEIYNIPSVNRCTIGKYIVEVQNSTVPGLILSSELFIVEAVADISGYLTFNDVGVQTTGRPSTFKEMTLYQIKDGAYDVIPFNEVTGERDLVNGKEGVNVKLNSLDNDRPGFYEFKKVLLRDYLIRGFADTLIVQYERVVPTWLTDNPDQSGTLYWEEADTLVLEANVFTEDFNASERPIPPSAGFGTLTGTLYDVETDEGGRVLARERAKNKPVTVRRLADVGRGNAELYITVAYLFTKDDTENNGERDGEFTFTKLEGLEYLLNFQYPGYPMNDSPGSFINIPIVDDLFGRYVSVEAYVEDEKIFVQRMIITGWEKEANNTMMAYPNPTVEFVYVKGLSNQSTKFSMVDSNGRTLPSSAKWNALETRWEVDVRELKRGVYILQVEQNGTVKKLRIMVKQNTL